MAPAILPDSKCRSRGLAAAVAQALPVAQPGTSKRGLPCRDRAGGVGIILLPNTRLSHSAAGPRD